MLEFAVFKRSDYSGQITGVDWQSVDILLNRCDTHPNPQTFSDFREILSGFIEAENETQKR